MDKKIVHVPKISVFRNKSIRKTIYKNEWWFSVVDVVGILTDSDNPRDYWYKMKVRTKDESGVELSTNCRQLKLEPPDGKKITYGLYFSYRYCEFQRCHGNG